MGKGTDGVVANLRRQLRQADGRRDGAPAEVRRQVVELAREERAAGRTVRQLAHALGVHESTVCRWAREAAVAKPSTSWPESGFSVVTVAASSPPEPRPESSPRVAALRLVHPSGLVVEGLDVAGVAALLARLS